MSEQTDNSSLPMNTKIPTGQNMLAQEMNIPVVANVSIWDLMDPENENVYGPGTLDNVDSIDNVIGLFLLARFLKSFEEKLDPFTIPAFRYVCSNDPDNIFNDQHYLDIVQTRRLFIMYIKYQDQECRTKFSGEEIDAINSGLKDQIKPWLSPLIRRWLPLRSSEIYDYDEDITVEDLEIVIKKCVTKIFANFNQKTVETALAKLYTKLKVYSLEDEELEISSLEDEELYEIIASEISNCQYKLRITLTPVFTYF